MALARIWGYTLLVRHVIHGALLIDDIVAVYVIDMPRSYIEFNAKFVVPVESTSRCDIGLANTNYSLVFCDLFTITCARCSYSNHLDIFRHIIASYAYRHVRILDSLEGYSWNLRYVCATQCIIVGSLPLDLLIFQEAARRQLTYLPWATPLLDLPFNVQRSLFLTKAFDA